jgi:hypothetical protein
MTGHGLSRCVEAVVAVAARAGDPACFDIIRASNGHRTGYYRTLFHCEELMVSNAY